MKSIKSQKGSPESYSLFLIRFLHFIPPLAALYYIVFFGVNVVFWDQWEIVPLFEKLHNGSLRFTDLFAQHNEHRILFPKIIMLILGFLTHYNTKAETVLMFILTAGTWLLFFLSFRRGLLKQHAIILFLPVTFIIFNLKQMESFLAGFPNCLSMAQFFSLLALYLISVFSENTNRKGLIVIAALCAFVASFSASSGLFVWPAGLLQLLLMRGTKKPGYALFWSSLCAVTVALFLFNFKTPAMGAFSFWHPGQVLKFMLLLTGNLFYIKRDLVIVVGALIMFLVLIASYLALREEKTKETSFWLACIIFSLFVIFSIAVGRTSRTQSALELRYNALQMRYIIYSLVLVSSAYCLLWRLYLTSRMKDAAKVCLCIFLIVFLGSLTFDYSGGIELGRRNFTLKLFLSHVLVHFETQPNHNLSMLYPDPEVVRKRAPVLKRLRYNVFSTPEK